MPPAPEPGCDLWSISCISGQSFVTLDWTFYILDSVTIPPTTWTSMEVLKSIFQPIVYDHRSNILHSFYLEVLVHIILPIICDYRSNTSILFGIVITAPTLHSIWNCYHKCNTMFYLELLSQIQHNVLFGIVITDPTLHSIWNCHHRSNTTFYLEIL